MHPPSITTGRGPCRNDELGPGRSAAPGEQRLTLLPSGPDVVHASPLRGTRSSTLVIPLASAKADLGRGFSPAGAVCRYRAPLVPRLARLRKHSVEAKGAGRDGGEGGIRTRDGFPHTAFPVPRTRPLCDLSLPATARVDEPAALQTSLRDARSCRGRQRTRDIPTPRGTGQREHLRRERPTDRDERWRRGRDSNPRCYSHTAFRERHLKPLGHLSTWESNKALGT